MDGKIVHEFLFSRATWSKMQSKAASKFCYFFPNMCLFEISYWSRKRDIWIWPNWDPVLAIALCNFLFKDWEWNLKFSFLFSTLGSIFFFFNLLIFYLLTFLCHNRVWNLNPLIRLKKSKICFSKLINPCKIELEFRMRISTIDSRCPWSSLE